MIKAKMICLFAFVSLFGLSACNMPTTRTVEDTPPPVLKIRMNVTTEYRTGPGQIYDLVGELNPGQEVEAVGRSLDGDYLVFRNPANPAVLWWLKSENVTVVGDPIGLPISNPPTLSTPIAVPTMVGGCPTPVGGGPTPVSCDTTVDPPPVAGGCPTPVGGGPTPVSCGPSVDPAPVAGGCPTPVGGGPTPVSCSSSVDPPPTVGGCPTPVGGGPTPVSCDT